VSIDYFYQGLEPDGAMPSPPEQQAQERMQRPETIELIRSYYAIPDPEARERFLQMVKTVAQSQRPR
jgi:hypothetical protein